MTTEAQKWARERNMTGGRLAGIIVNLRSIGYLRCLTLGETLLISAAIDKLDTVHQMWKNKETMASSKKYYLKGDKP